MYPSARKFEQFTIQFAESEAQRRSACHLRYGVFAREMGRALYADHRSESYSDELDAGRAHVLLARSADQDVGTLRFTLRRETEFLDEDELYFGEFISQHGKTAIALADRGVIVPAFRSFHLYPQMWDYGFEFLRGRGIKFVLGVIDAKDDALVRFHERQQWSVLAEGVLQGERTWNLIVREL